jgi:hypothetical protein
MEEWSLQKLDERLQEGLKKMSFDELRRFYDENKHVFSKEHREAIEDLLKTIKEKSVMEEHSRLEEAYEKNYGGYGGTVGASVGIPAGVDSFSASASARTGRESAETFRTVDGMRNVTKDDLVKALSKAITDSVSSQDSHAVGNTFEKVFRNQEEFREAMKAAEQYKEAKSLETAISVNALPIVVQRLGDRLYSQHDVIGLENRYSMAVRDLIQAVHSGNTEKIKEFTKEFKEVQKELTQQRILDIGIPNRGERLKKDVGEGIRDTFKDLYTQGPRPSTAKGWGWEGPVVERDAEKISQNLPKPKGPRARKRG